MGKYDGVLGKIPKMPRDLFDGGAEYQVRVQLVKEAIPTTERTSPQLAASWIELRSKKDLLEEQISDLNLRLRALEQLMEDAFEGDGLRSIRLESGGVRYEPGPHAIVDDPDKYRQWCVDSGLEHLMSLAWSTTNTMVKEALLRGENPPPGVRVFSRPKFVISR